MTENGSPDEQPDVPLSAPPASSGPVSVVGYPDQATAATTPVVPGMAGVRMAISSVRLLAVISLVLALLIALGGVLGIVLLRDQVSDLQAQVADLSAQQSELAAQAAQAPQAAQPAPAPNNEDPAAEGSSVAQLPPAPTMPNDIPAPTGVDESGAIVVGDPNAANVVEVYVDYQCPFCQRWESEIGTLLVAKAQEDGSDLQLKQYNLAFLGETSPNLDPPGASARAASAAFCFLEGEGPDAFVEFNAEIFAQADPAEPASQFATEVMSALASEFGASAETIACIEEERHVPFTALSTQVGFARGVQGTPTVVVNGRTVESSFSDTELLGLLGSGTSS